LEAEIKELRDAGAHLLQRKNTQQAFAIPQKPSLEFKGHHRGINALSVHPFGTVASGSEDATIKLWDSETSSLLNTLKGHLKSVNDVVFSPDGRYLISCSSDLSIKIWSVEADYQCIRTLHGHDNTISSICYIPTMNLIASASRDETVRIWEVATGYCIQTLTGHSDWIRSVSSSEDGDLLVTAGNDKNILVWETSNWTIKAELCGHSNVIESAQFLPLQGNKSLDIMLNRSSGSNTTQYVISTSRDKTIRIWSLTTFDCVKTLVHSIDVGGTRELDSRLLFLPRCK
jgi:platelet-activating factor acetylhydrolase IB subunit alpha